MPERIGELLVSKGLLTRDELDKALKLKLSSKKKLGEILIEEKYLTGRQVLEHLYRQLYEKIKNVLQPMADAEIRLSEFYLLCAKMDKDNRDFWESVSKDELRHAANLGEMIELVYKRPEAFSEGRAFKEAAIRTFLNGLEIYMDKLKNNSMPGRNLLYLARDFEHTMLEIKYSEAIESRDEEFINFVSQIRKQDEGHLVKFQNKIKELERKMR